MGVAQKTLFSILDRLANFFGISGAPMEHNAIAKSKQTFFLQIRHKRPRTKRCREIIKVRYILLTKTTAAQNEDALSYYTVRGLYFLAVIFVRSPGPFILFLEEKSFL